MSWNLTFFFFLYFSLTTPNYKPVWAQPTCVKPSRGELSATHPLKLVLLPLHQSCALCQVSSDSPQNKVRLFLILSYKRFQQKLFRAWNIHDKGCKMSQTWYYFSSKLELMTSNKIIKMVRFAGKEFCPIPACKTAKWISLAPLRGSRTVTGVSRFLLK